MQSSFTDYLSTLVTLDAQCIAMIKERAKEVFFSKGHMISSAGTVFERAMRKVSDRSFIVAYDRAFTLLTMSATERYRKLIEEEPHLLRMFSNQYIASYLGITPQSLSRIKSSYTS